MIELTNFALRHFDPDFKGTKFSISPAQFISRLVQAMNITEIRNLEHAICEGGRPVRGAGPRLKIIDGYADFCKLIFVHNFTMARTGSMRLTNDNYQYLRSGYSARRESELPVLSRWLDLPMGAPEAKYLCIVVYSKEHLKKEGDEIKQDWGIVSIMAQNTMSEEPMKPATMIRNAMGIEEGGSGVPLDKEAYQRSVEFWSKHVTVR